MSAFPFADWTESLRALSEDAGRATLKFVGNQGARTKSDGSPVTLADAASEKILLRGLNALTPRLPIVSEEQAEADPGSVATDADAYWLVDPLDGTKEFIAGGTDFTVNIGLIQNGAPIFGVVHLPAQAASYVGTVGVGAQRWMTGGSAEPITVAKPQTGAITAVASRRHDAASEVDELLAARGLTIAERIQVGSSLKFCRVAEGEAHIYPRLGPTMEWDTAAGHAVLLAAGGRVETLDGAPLAYGKADRRNPGFIAFGAV